MAKDTDGMATTKRKPKKEPRAKLIEAALKLAESEDWRFLGMPDIAEAAGLGLAEALRIFPNKSSIVCGLMRDVDDAVLTDLSTDSDTDGSAKDRLFDQLMRRFDILRPHKDGLAGIVGGFPHDPLGGVRQMVQLHCSMALMLEAAGLSSAGCNGILRTKGLTFVYFNALRAWFRDDSPDMAKTMAALDKGLTAADRLAALCWPAGGTGASDGS